MFHSLFQPCRLKSLTLENRIVMAPMTRTFAPGGVPTREIADYYRRRVEGGVGLIISEGAAVDRPAARNHPGIPLFHGTQALDGWGQVIAEVHRAGGKMGPQIWHVGPEPGYRTEWMPDGKIESPSGLLEQGRPRGSAMTEEDIADTIAAFASAAASARALGFDVLEIHGAHGYLIDKFFQPETNLRTDRYGGESLKQRSRFAAELIRSVRRAVGPDFPLILRVSQWKSGDFDYRLARTPQELGDWLMPLVEAGVDVLHCSQRRFWEAAFPEVDGERGLNLAGWAKKTTGATTITVGSVGIRPEPGCEHRLDLTGLCRRLDREEFDLVAVGRAILSDPGWPMKLRAGDLDAVTSFDPAHVATLA